MNILILEDDYIQLTGLSQYIQHLYPKWTIYTATNYSDAINLSSQFTIQLFILDIDLQETRTGIDFSSWLRSKEYYQNTNIIFLTRKGEHIHQAINEIHCYGYLPKPYCKEDVEKMLLTISTQTTISKPQTVLIYDENHIACRMNPIDILYAETSNRRILIHCVQTTFLTGYCTIGEFMKKFPSFIQIHKKYLVNPEHIKFYDKSTNSLTGNKFSVPVGKSYKNNVEAYFH